MPRTPRIEYPGAIYHLMNRGNQLRRVFWDDADRKAFLTTLAEVCRRTGWQVHAFALMPNHYHLFQEDDRPESPRLSTKANGRKRWLNMIDFPVRRRGPIISRFRHSSRSLSWKLSIYACSHGATI